MPSQAQRKSEEPMSNEQIVAEILLNEAKAAEYTKLVKRGKEELLQRHKVEIADKLAHKDEPFGTVNIIIGDKKVVVDTKKKVEWDQDKLAAKVEEIRKDGGNPADYVKIEYSVSEKAWSVWGENIRKHFVDARTVTPANPTVKIEEIKE